MVVQVDTILMCLLNAYAVIKQESAASDIQFLTMFAALVHADRAVGSP